MAITIFLCGDVMTGRGIDQVLPHPSDPQIHEPSLKSAVGYVELAESESGSIKKPVAYTYVWGDALSEFQRVKPDARIINLETSITANNDFWKGKGINYRMHPGNVPVLTSAGVDVAVLANNHVLDWGYGGLSETIETLRKAGVRTAGAGKAIGEAEAPAVLDLPGKGRLLVFSFGSVTSGILPGWAATEKRPGVNLLQDLSDDTVTHIRDLIERFKQKGDIIIASIHWGANWGFDVPSEHQRFARKLIRQAGVDIIHGHSSHHVKGIEVYQGRLILYGAGDFLNDYEGIGGRESFRPDLGLMYFAVVEPGTGLLKELRMVPTQVRNFRVKRAAPVDAQWLRDTLNREGRKLGTRVEMLEDHSLMLRWE